MTKKEFYEKLGEEFFKKLIEMGIDPHTAEEATKAHLIDCLCIDMGSTMMLLS